MQFEPSHVEVAVGFGLFVLSEAIGLSKYRPNSVVQLLLAAAMRAFPYQLQKKEPPKPRNIFDALKGGDRNGR